MGACSLFGQATRTRTRDEILAPLPPDQDRDYLLIAEAPQEGTAPDGTVVSIVLHHRNDTQPGGLLRVWNRRGDRYSFLKAVVVAGEGYPSAEFFHFQGNLYLHLMKSFDGFANVHEDQIFRVERNTLTPIRPIPGPLNLAPDETINRGEIDRFEDDSLTFEFGIWKKTEPACCPSTMVEGTYTIVGNEIRVATSKRRPVPH